MVCGSANHRRQNRASQSQEVDIFISINEGPQFHIHAVTIEGIQIVTEANFRKVIKVTEGQVFSPGKLEKDIKAVEDAYGIAGYADAKVAVQTSPAGPALVDLHYKIEEELNHTWSGSILAAIPGPR